MDNATIQLQLWDITSLEEKGNKTRVFFLFFLFILSVKKIVPPKNKNEQQYYENADGALILSDVTNPISLEEAKRWKVDLDNKTNKKIPAVLLANKTDMPHSPPNRDKLGEFLFNNKFSKYHEVSANDGRGLEEAFIDLLTQIYAPEGEIN